MSAAGPPSPEPLRAVDLLRFVALAGGIGLLVDATLVSQNGSAAIALAGPIPPGVVLGLALAGIVAAAAGFLSGGRATWRSAARSAPELYPFGGPWLQLGVYLLVAVGASAIVHALLVAYSGADSSGAAATPVGSAPGDLLLVAGSLVLWVLAVYAVCGLRRFIQVGRALDARRGIDPFHTRPPSRDPLEPPWVPSRGPAPPGLVGAGAAVGIVTWIVMVAVAVGIQVLETPIGPVAPGVFWWSQLATLAAAGVVTVALRTVDRGVRDIERQYSAGDGTPAPSVPPAAAPSAPGFVP